MKYEGEQRGCMKDKREGGCRCENRKCDGKGVKEEG